jgi:hypothetical protein
MQQHEDYAMAEHVLGKRGSKKASPKPLREFHAKELHSGGMMVTKHSGKPGEAPTEHGAKDLNAVHDLLDEHMEQPQAEAAETQPDAE